MKRKLVFLAAATAAAALALAAACSGSGTGTLSVRATTGASATSAAVDADGGATPGLDLGNGIVLTEVRLFVRRIVLETAAPDGGAATCSACSACTGCTGESCEHCEECDDCEDAADHVKAGPVLVDLKGAELIGGIHAVLDASVPAGDYSEVKFVISQVSRKLAKEHPELAAMKDLHASIVVDGTIDGTAFEFRTPMHVQEERDGTFQVGSGTSVLTLLVDPSGWFTGDHGQRLDPRAPRDRGEILENIRCSFRVLSDGDHDDGWGHHHGCAIPGTPDGGTPDGGSPDGGSPDGGTLPAASAG